MEFDLERRVFRPTEEEDRLIKSGEVPEDQADKLLGVIAAKFDQVVDIDISEFPAGSRRREMQALQFRNLNLLDEMRDVVLPIAGGHGVAEVEEFLRSQTE